MSEKVTNLSEYIAENFGANASYVEGLLNRYTSDPNSVDESWRTFFGDLMAGNASSERGNGQATADSEPQTITAKVEEKQVEITAKKPTTGDLPEAHRVKGESLGVQFQGRYSLGGHDQFLV